MSRSVDIAGDTQEEAVAAALEELGATRDEVEVEIVEEQGKGLLGLRKAKTTVRVTIVERGSVAAGVVKDILAYAGVEASVEAATEDDETWVRVSGDDLAWLIGHHGKTLDALQVLAGAISSKKTKAPARMIVDVEGYREQRKKEIHSLTERTIGKVIAREEAISLRPMSAMERKMVHVVAGQYEGVTSISKGFDPDRFVIISPARD